MIDLMRRNGREAQAVSYYERHLRDAAFASDWTAMFGDAWDQPKLAAWYLIHLQQAGRTEAFDRYFAIAEKWYRDAKAGSGPDGGSHRERPL